VRTVMGKAIFLKRRTVIASKVARSATTQSGSECSTKRNRKLAELCELDEVNIALQGNVTVD